MAKRKWIDKLTNMFTGKKKEEIAAQKATLNRAVFRPISDSTTIRGAVFAGLNQRQRRKRAKR
jgi:hypothetical protein